MNGKFNDGFDLYNFIKKGERDIASLSAEEAMLLFNYTCTLLEQGSDTDITLLNACCDRLEYSPESTPEEVIALTYNRLSPRRSRIGFKKVCLRRILVAALAVLTFVVSSFITASALGVDIVESVKTVFGEDNTPIQFTSYAAPDSNGNPSIRRYNSLSMLFESNLPEYIYPSQLPDGIVPYAVTHMAKESGRLFILKMRSDGNEPWIIHAAPADKSYLPMGYIYNGKNLRFVYTLSRKGEQITKYTVYTVHKGIQYTFYLHTGDWDEVLIILDSLVVK